MRFKQDIPTYNAPIFCAPNLGSVKSDAARKRKKNPRIHDSLCEFGPHRHDAGMRHFIIVCTASLIVKIIAY
jgi:hypothetical protein